MGATRSGSGGLESWSAEAGSGSRLSSTVLEEGAVQEGGQLRPIVLQGGRKAWGMVGRGPPCGPPRLAVPGCAPHLVDKAVVHQLGGQVLGTVGCGRGVGTGREAAAPPARARPAPARGPARRPTWEQVVGELPVQPVLQHQEQRELGRREGEVGSGVGPAPPALPRLCGRGPPSHASVSGPRFSPGYTASGSPGGRGRPRSPTKAGTQQLGSKSRCCVEGAQTQRGRKDRK